MAIGAKVALASRRDPEADPIPCQPLLMATGTLRRRTSPSTGVSRSSTATNDVCRDIEPVRDPEADDLRLHLLVQARPARSCRDPRRE